MNKEDILTRFYANRLESDYTHFINAKAINGTCWNEEKVRKLITNTDEYKDLLVELLKAVGYFK